jgi:hypothetical protein
MNQNAADEQALIKIQHDWAEARIKCGRITSNPLKEIIVNNPRYSL